MKFTSMAVLAALLCGSCFADGLTINSINITIPDGSVVTSEQFIPAPAQGYLNEETVDYSFQGGTGTSSGFLLDLNSGSVYFDSPVSQLAFTWDADIYFIAELYSGNTLVGTVDVASDDLSTSVFGSSFFIGQNITSIQWTSGLYYGGISDLIFNSAPVSAPEPSSLGLMLAGAALTFLGKRLAGGHASA